MKKKLTDLRFLIGVLFFVYGVILIIYGWIFNPQTKVLNGFNIDFWWGFVLFVISFLFLLPVLISSSKKIKNTK